MMEKFLAWDARVSQQLRVAEKPGALHRAASFLAHSGDSWFWLLALVLVAWLGTDYWRWRAIAIGISILVAAVLVLAIKFSVRRGRPEGEWGEIYRSTDPHSFPSGHAVRAFLIAVMMIAFGPMWLALLLVIWAPLVGLARVAMGVHYLSDVLAGALLGILLGALGAYFTADLLIAHGVL
jgi:undecaprenyl-diphosphatase